MRTVVDSTAAPDTTPMTDAPDTVRTSEVTMPMPARASGVFATAPMRTVTAPMPVRAVAPTMADAPPVPERLTYDVIPPDAIPRERPMFVARPRLTNAQLGALAAVAAAVVIATALAVLGSR
jgi:hypothetical protein